MRKHSHLARARGWNDVQKLLGYLEFTCATENSGYVWLGDAAAFVMLGLLESCGFSSVALTLQVMPFWGWCKNLGKTTVETFVIEDAGFRGTAWLAASLVRRSIYFVKGLGRLFCGMCRCSECLMATSGLKSSGAVAHSCWELSSVTWAVSSCAAGAADCMPGSYLMNLKA